MTEEVPWFTISVPLGPVLPSDAIHACDLASLINRSEAAVSRAIDEGRLPRARDLPAALPRGRSRYVTAVRADIARWYRQPLEEVLRRRPDLPQDPNGWLSQSEVARRLEIGSWAAAAMLRRLDPPRLAWGSQSFRQDVRYFVPDITGPAA